MKRKVEFILRLQRPSGNLGLERFVDVIENHWYVQRIAKFDGYVPVRFSLAWHFHRKNPKPLRPSRATKLWERIAENIEKRGFIGECNLVCGGATLETFQIKGEPWVEMKFWRDA